MSTVSWLELLTVVTVLIGTLMYHFGYAMAREQAEINETNRQRAACKSRHPAGKKLRPTLRIVTHEREDT